MRVVIIGSGAAGATAAEEIRKADGSCEITVISDESYPYYSRPRVIEFLTGKVPEEKIFIKKSEWFAENKIELLLSTFVEKIDTAAKQVKAGGVMINYDKLIIAAGASSFAPPFPGAKDKGVFTLRTIDDAKSIMQYAQGRKKAVVIGGGLLGIEAANSLKEHGLKVTIVEVFDRLLPRQLDGQTAAILKEKLENMGLNFILNKQTTAIEDKQGKKTVKFADDSFEETDMVLISAGIRSNLKIIEGTNIDKMLGIKIDGFGRTNMDSIYACGDIAEFNGRVYGIWPAAREQAIAAASHITGGNAEYKGTVMSVKLKVAGIELASMGDISGDGTEVEVKKENENFKKIFIRDDKVAGAILIGNTGDYVKIQKMIKEGSNYTDAL
ncbi:MAG: NAD(P)/FAD-dependent oxidoreductase [Candidatus Goldiibacteriota bacterium HGW-Goldbacteria-1]|jgi:nitrite reductase (NADH) large subunit|nr:MAG: NAD(P)/FAD-dependent oxidoreductase [Candidatus Goldiibacteriota bacterium HGW-Goldbacteria-1]